MLLFSIKTCFSELNTNVDITGRRIDCGVIDIIIKIKLLVKQMDK